MYTVWNPAANFVLSILSLPSPDLLRVSFPPSLPASSRLLRWGGEADGFGVWTTRRQRIWRRDADPSRAHVPWGSPHVASPCCTNTDTQCLMPMLERERWEKREREQRDSLCSNWKLQCLSHSKDQVYSQQLSFSFLVTNADAPPNFRVGAKHMHICFHFIIFIRSQSVPGCVTG